MYRQWLNHLRDSAVRVVMPGYSFECILVDPSVIDAGDVTGIWFEGGVWAIRVEL